MNNCKIRIYNEAESKEAQELFEQLGYEKGVCGSGEYPATIVAVVNGFYCDTPFSRRAISLNHDAHKDYIELTLPQLRDLVVLHRNDVNDANYESTYEEHDDLYFKDSSGKLYRWFCGSHWAEAASYKGEIRPIKNQYTEQSLISGADALRALADGKEVEYLYGTQWESATGNQILISAFIGDKFKFRIKPQTIKIELEIPKPFLPKDGDMVWFISRDNTCGYSHDVFGHGLEEKWIQYGAWRTKEEIKIVVEQLRKIKEHSK